MKEECQNCKALSEDLEETCKELNQMMDACGFNEAQMFNTKTGLVNCLGKSIERLRDLVAKEGELGDLKAIVREAHKELCKAADTGEKLFVDNARAMLGDALNEPGHENLLAQESSALPA